MNRPKRKFTTPMGSGRASTLGAGDPRPRRDAAARGERVASGDSDQVAALAAQVAALTKQVAALKAAGN